MRALALLFGLCGTLSATNYAFVDPKCHWHVDASYAKVAKASFTTHSVKDSSLFYSEGGASLYFSHFLNSHNCFSWQVGYQLLDIDWNQNPRFRQKIFNLASASLAWVSTGLDRWRWILRLGGTVDAERFDVGHSGVAYGLAWGRYRANENFHLHIGIFGFAGIRTAYLLPIAGFDYVWNRWRFNLIFPMDTSLTYNFSSRWSLAIAYLNFGGPYHYPYRAHEGTGGRYHNPILEVYSTAAALKLRYHYNPFISATLSGGWNLGGWLLIKDDEGHHGKYYKYDGAPYAEAKVNFTF